MNMRELVEKRENTQESMKKLHEEAGDEALGERAQKQWDGLETYKQELDVFITRQSKIDEWDKKAAEPVAAVTADGDDFELQCRSFSYQNLIAYQLGAKGVDTAREVELSTELQKRSGRTFEGMAAPLSALSTRAASDLTTTKPTAGPISELVAPDFRTDLYVDLLRNQSVLSQLPVTRISGLKGTITYPRALSGVTGAWVAEDAAATHESLTFDQSTLGPMKWASTICQFGRQAMLSSAIGIEGLIRADFAAALSRLLDTAFLANTTTNGPRGIVNQSNSDVYSPTATDTNGLKFTWADFRNMAIEPMQKENITGSGAAFLTSVKARNFYEQELKAGGRNGYLIENGNVAGAPVHVSNAVSDTGSKGSGRNLSTVIFGLWSHFLVATADELDIMSNPYATDAFDRGAIQVRAMMAMDWASRHDGAFQVYDDLISQ